MHLRTWKGALTVSLSGYEDMEGVLTVSLCGYEDVEGALHCVAMRRCHVGFIKLEYRVNRFNV